MADTDKPDEKIQQVLPVLDYRTPGYVEYRRGATKAARAVAWFLSPIFVVFTVTLTVAAFDNAWDLLPAIVVSAGGTAFCLLVACGLIGEHKLRN